MGEIVPIPGVYRHDQPGYYALSELPQGRSVEEICCTTGWSELDEIFKLYPGQFVITTGIAGHGKSTFLLNVLANVARVHDMRSFLYVPENESHIRNKMRRLWPGTDEEFARFCAEQCFLQSSNHNRYDEAPRTLQWVLDKAVVAVERDGVDLVMIDPWNELERAKPPQQLMTDYIGECLMYLKGFCKVMKATVLLVAHPTKAGVSDGKVPGLGDIEGSMNWFNKCDNGLIVHREKSANSCRVISAKVREIGAGRRGECYFTVDPATGRFTPMPGAVL